MGQRNVGPDPDPAKTYLEVVPVNFETGEVLSWSALFAAISAAASNSIATAAAPSHSEGQSYAPSTDLNGAARVLVLDENGVALDYTESSLVHTAVQLADVTLSADTAAYASGDVIADSQAVDAMTSGVDFEGVLQSVLVVDKADQKVAMTLIYFSANVALGTENSAPSISDANAVNILGFIDIAAGAFNALTNPNGWIDIGGASVAKPAYQPFVVKPLTGDDAVYVAALNGTGTPTFGASDIVVRHGVI